MIEFRMPSLGADMEVGTVLEWRIKPGDTVARGDVVALVDTEKAEIEVEIWDAGVVTRLVVPVGEQVPVGALLAELDGEETSSLAPGHEVSDTAALPVPSREPGPPTAPRPGPRGGRASPRVRKRAREEGVDLATVEGTGAAGVITWTDVETARAQQDRREHPKEDSSAERETDRETSMRRAIARAMERSNREIPHYYLETDVDFSIAQSWLAEENDRLPVTQRILASALILKAVALALDEVPELNGHWIDGEFRPSAVKHVGVAIGLRGGGLMAPAIHDVDQKDLGALMVELRDLVNRTRRGKLRSSELTDATITLTSLGDLGVDKVYGVIYPPQVALVGFGQIVEKPWAEHGMLDVRPVASATLAADHRASDGARGAKFLGALASRLAHPEQL